MPYTCTSCIDFTKEKLAFDKTCTAPDTVLVKVENDEQMEVLRRYMEIFNQSKVWVDHNKTTMMNDDCSEHCCVALQLDPYKPVTVDCSTELSAICSTEVDGKFITHMYVRTCIYIHTGIVSIHLCVSFFF